MIKNDQTKIRFLSREDILQKQDISYEDVEVPEWGGTVRVKAMNGTERDEFESSMLQNAGTKAQAMNTRNIRAKLVCKTCVGEDLKPLFTVADIEVLGKKSAAALDRVYEVASRLSKVSEADVEELVKNSVTDPSDISTTD